MTAHYEAKNRHLHNPKPRYNADERKKGGSNLSLFDLTPAGASNSLTLDFEEWRTITLYIFNNLTEVRPYIE